MENNTTCIWKYFKPNQINRNSRSLQVCYGGHLTFLSTNEITKLLRPRGIPVYCAAFHPTSSDLLVNSGSDYDEPIVLWMPSQHKTYYSTTDTMST